MVLLVLKHLKKQIMDNFNRFCSTLSDSKIQDSKDFIVHLKMEIVLQLRSKMTVIQNLNGRGYKRFLG